MIEWIVTSSALILLVLLLRTVIKNRVSPQLRYALWALVLLRLLIPGTLWESKASVMTPVAAQEEYQAVERIPRYVRTMPDGWVEIGHPNSGSWTSIPAERAASDEPARYDWFSRSENVSIETLREQVNVRNAFLMIWLAGVALMGTFLLMVNLKFSCDLKKKRRTVGQYQGLWVFVMEGLATPCLFGLLHPGVYLTPELSEDEKPHVLAHEYAHFRQRDHIWAALRGVCLAVHWYNPLVWLAAVLSRRDCELSCDEGAVRLLGEEHRADYGRTLVGLVARRTTPKDLACCATTMTGGRSALKERIALLVKKPKTTAFMACIVAVACAVFAVCTFTGAAEAEEPDEPVEPVQTEQEQHKVDSSLPSFEELPVQVIDAYTLGDLYENTAPYWLLAQVDSEDIALYGINPMGTSDEVRGIYLRYGEHLQYFDQVAMPYQFICPQLTWYDFDGDGENELLVIYAVLKGTTVDINELVVYEWEGDQWSEHKYDPAGLMDDFNANAQFESDDGMSRISYRGTGTQVALGGEECFIRGGVVAYDLREDRSIRLTLWGEIGPTLTSTNYAFDYMCDIRYDPDGTFAEENGIFSSFYEPEELPALEDLPTRIVSPGTPEAEADIWLAAELPEYDIAVYYDTRNSGGYLRYGGTLQSINISLVTMPQMLLPELHFEDLDGDGEKELVVSYYALYGTGVTVSELVVYEWNGQKWTGYRPDLAKSVIDDFNANRTLMLSRDTGAAEVSYLGSTVVVDMNAVYEGREWPSDAPHSCALDEWSYSYDWHRSGTVFLHIWGTVQADGHPTDRENILYTCGVAYHADGSFTIEDRGSNGLSTGYPYYALTPTFREILLDYISERQEALGGDISADRFAVCDVNGDGRNELITQTNAAPMAGQVETVYDADGNKLLAEYPLMTYYDNGYAKAGWSHNQGAAGNMLWPYTLLKYDADAGKYVRVAAVDGWDKSIRDTYLSYDETVIPFPDDVDKDGDGFVYYIIEEEGGYAPEYGEPMDYAEYAQWVARYLGGNAVQAHYASLSEWNIALIQLQQGER